MKERKCATGEACSDRFIKEWNFSAVVSSSSRVVQKQNQAVAELHSSRGTPHESQTAES